MTRPDDAPTLATLRRAVDDAAAQPDHHLADRLLTGVRSRRQARRTRGVALAVLLLVGLTAGVLRLLPGSGPDELRVAEPPVAQPPFGEPPVAVLTAKAVTREQAARSGLDGSSQCESPAVRAPGPMTGAGPALTLVAGYLTDERGLKSWTEEYHGMYSSSGPEGPGGLVAVCWFSGPVPGDGSGGPPVEGNSLLLVVNLTGAAGLGQQAQSVDPLPVLAPPAPAAELLTGDLAAAATVVHPQPTGVAVVDVLVRPSPPPPVPTQDCAPIGCPTAEELPVRIDVLLDGRAVPLMERQSAPPGEVLEVEVTVDVPADAELTGLVLGSSGEGSRIEQVLATAPRQGPGPVTYRLEWTVAGAPGDLAQLRLEYTQAVTPDGVGAGGSVNRPFVLLDVE